MKTIYKILEKCKIRVRSVDDENRSKKNSNFGVSLTLI